MQEVNKSGVLLNFFFALRVFFFLMREEGGVKEKGGDDLFIPSERKSKKGEGRKEGCSWMNPSVLREGVEEGAKEKDWTKLLILFPL